MTKLLTILSFYSDKHMTKAELIKVTALLELTTTYATGSFVNKF